jgi:apolipoprotein N-acyltransferase
VLRIPMSDFSPGAAAQTPMSLAGERIAANICYEDVFGERIARALPEATLHVNLSNTAWFGDSLAQPQHLQIARVRALETGRYMLRATNTGMTAVVDPAGTVAAAIPAFTRGALRATVRGFAGSTPYARWGNAAFLSLSGIALMLAIGARARAGAAGPGIAEYK